MTIVDAHADPFSPPLSAQSASRSKPATTYLVQTGRLRLWQGRSTYVLEVGDVAMVGSNETHGVRTLTTDTGYVETVLGGAAAAAAEPIVVRGFAKLHPGIAALMVACPTRRIPTSGVGALIASTIEAAVLDSWVGLEMPRRAVDPQIAELVAAIVADPAAPWSVADLARRVHLSRTALLLRFRQATGASPGAVVLRARIARGCELLRHGSSVAVVAGLTGYASTAAFSRAFRRVLGVAPSTWRRGDRG